MEGKNSTNSPSTELEGGVIDGSAITHGRAVSRDRALWTASVQLPFLSRNTWSVAGLDGSSNRLKGCHCMLFIQGMLRYAYPPLTDVESRNLSNMRINMRMPEDRTWKAVVLILSHMYRYT